MFPRSWISAFIDRLHSNRRNRSRRRALPRPMAVEVLEQRSMLANFVVDTLVDENDGIGVGTGTSLREVMLASQTNHERDTITFSVSGTINLIDEELPQILSTLTIDGGTLGNIVINGAGNKRLFSIDFNADIGFLNLELRNGNDAGSGGGGGAAIHKQGGRPTARLLIQNCRIVDCLSQDEGTAIRIENGNALIVNSTISGHDVVPSGRGGAIFNAAGTTLTVLNSEIVGNRDGGVLSEGLTLIDASRIAENNGGTGSEAGLSNRAGTMIVTRSDIVLNGNSSGTAGAGIHNFAGARLEVRGSTVSGNISNGDGAGIHNDGIAEIIDTVLASNRTTGGDDGGAIYNTGILTVEGATMSGNHAFGGSGVYNDGGTAHLVDVTISGNSAAEHGGAGITNRNGELSLVDSTVDGNFTTTPGGGIRHEGGNAVTTIIRSTISDNFSGNASVESFGGGGIYVDGGRVTIETSTISGNETRLGGGAISISSGAVVTVVGSTIADNTAERTGGGILGTANLTSTIIAGNTSNGVGPDVVGMITGNHNLVGDTTDATVVGTNNLLDVDPALAPLAENGGPNRTHALLPGSPALANGIDTAPLGIDQRGEPRPQGNGLDIGAYESSLVPMQLVALQGERTLVLFGDDAPEDVVARNIHGLLPGERVLSLDSRQEDRRVYLLTDQNNLYTVEVSTGRATFVSALTVGLNDGTAADVDAARNLNISHRGLFLNSLGMNEKWIFGTTPFGSEKQWYVILPNGNVHEYVRGGLGNLAGAFGTNVYEDPTLLTNAFDGLGSLGARDQQDLVDADRTFRFFTHTETGNPRYTDLFRNARGLGEVWIKGDPAGTDNPWYVILPNGDVLKRNDDATLGPAPVATVNPIASLDPTVLTTAYDSTVGVIPQAVNPDHDRNFYYLRNGALKENSLGRGEKHFLGTTPDGTGVVEYFIEPNGFVYSTGDPGTILFNFGPDGYDALDRVVMAYDHVSDFDDATLETLADLDYGHGLFRWTNAGGDSGYYFNANGGNEKWIRGVLNRHGNFWYQITPSGDVYAWGGSGVGGTLLGSFGTELYENPQLLYEAYDRTAALGTGHLTGDTEVDIDFDNDPFAGFGDYTDNVVDSLGVIVDNGENAFHHVDVTTGFVVTEEGFGRINDEVDGFAYDGNGPGLVTTRGYVVLSSNDTWRRLNEQSGGVPNIGPLGIDVGDGGLEIVTDQGIERSYLLAEVDGEFRLHVVDKATGAATPIGANNGLVGNLGQFDDIHDLTSILR